MHSPVANAHNLMDLSQDVDIDFAREELQRAFEGRTKQIIAEVQEISSQIPQTGDLTSEYLKERTKPPFDPEDDSVSADLKLVIPAKGKNPQQELPIAQHDFGIWISGREGVGGGEELKTFGQEYHARTLASFAPESQAIAELRAAAYGEVNYALDSYISALYKAYDMSGLDRSVLLMLLKAKRGALAQRLATGFDTTALTGPLGEVLKQRVGEKAKWLGEQIVNRQA